MSKTLFKEAVRQLRKAMILSLGIICLISMLWIIMVRFWFMEFVPAFYPRVCGIVVTAFLTMYLFRFIGSKNGSDFYYQIPWMKQKLAFSYLAAIAVYVVIFTSALYLATGILAAVWQRNYMANPLTAAAEYLFGLSACVYMLGVIFLAVSLSGNLTSVIFIAGMIIIIPKALFVIWYTAVYENIPHVLEPETVYAGVGTVTRQYNIIWTTMQNLVNRYTEYSGENFITAIYSSAIGFLYLVLGVQIWKKRRAEAAGNPAMNGKVQAVLRILPAALCSFFMLTIIFAGKANWNSWPEKITKKHLAYLAAGFAGYLFCVALIYVYEILTTRKLWGGKRYFTSKLPVWAGILAGLDVLYFTSIFIVHRQVWYDAPDVSKIRSVQILDKMNVPDYVKTVLETIDFEDEEIKELFSEGLKDTIQCADEGNFYNYSASGIYAVVINKDFNSIVRTIYLDQEKEDRFAELLKQNGTWDKIYSNLPELDQDHFVQVDGIEEDIANTIYSTFKEEIKEIRLTDLYTNTQKEMFSINIFEGKTDGDDAQKLYSISIGMNYPKTVELFCKLFNAKYAADAPVEEFCEDLEQGNLKGSLEAEIYTSGKNKNEQKEYAGSVYVLPEVVNEVQASEEFCKLLRMFEKELLKEGGDGSWGWIIVRHYTVRGTAIHAYPLTEAALDLYRQVVECNTRILECYYEGIVY